MDAPSSRIDRALGATKTAILRHPFLSELHAGSLPIEAFIGYLSQNYHYLNSYAKALAQIAARSQDAVAVEFFAQRAVYTIASEREFASELAQGVGIDPSELQTARATPASVAYSSYIKQAAAYETLPVAMATLLPCYTLYSHVARQLIERGSPNEVYQRWIEMYVGDDFVQGVRGAEAACDRVAIDAPEHQVLAMIDGARMSALHEWAFLESAYRGLDWPDFDEQT